MSTAGKIALGCGVLAFLAVIAFTMMLVGGAWWAKKKVEQTVEKVTTGPEEIEDYTRKANAVPFERPAGGVVQEDRLRKFLEVRKGVHTIYEQYRGRLEGTKPEDVSVSDVTKAFGAINELRLAQAKSLAEIGMSEAEYRFIQMAVYQSTWATAAEGQTGKQMSEILAESARKADEAARAGIEQAGRVKVDGVGQVSPERIRKAQEQMAEMMAKAAEGAKKLEVPQANIDLFRKYKADIDKYAMSGLALLGL